LEWQRVPLEDLEIADDFDPQRLLDIDDALDRLAAQASRWTAVAFAQTPVAGGTPALPAMGLLPSTRRFNSVPTWIPQDRPGRQSSPVPHSHRLFCPRRSKLAA